MTRNISNVYSPAGFESPKGIGCPRVLHFLFEFNEYNIFKLMFNFVVVVVFSSSTTITLFVTSFDGEKYL